MVRIIWTQNALDDLSSIQAYIARDSVFYAEKFVDEVFLAVDRLEMFPEIGRMVPERNKSDFREIIFGSYRIMYKVTERDVHIVTIIHGKRNYKPE